MKFKLIIFAIISFVIFSGCAGNTNDIIVGTWKTGLIESEWGPQITTATYSSDGTVEGMVEFPETNGKLDWKGHYYIEDQWMIHDINGDKVKFSVSIKGKIMTLKSGKESYIFEKQ